MLELRDVSKRFIGTLAVDRVSFCARAGEVTGYLGPNGSGKSTTMKMITGLLEMTSGEILFDGVPIQRDLIAWKQRMGYVPEEPHLYGHLSGLEYLVMVGQLMTDRLESLDDTQMLTQCRLESRCRCPRGALPGRIGALRRP